MFEKDFERLLTEYKDALGDKARFTGLVKDFFPGQHMQVNLLLAAYNLGIVKEIDAVKHINNTFAYRFVKRLVEEQGISRMNADWTISMWCVCYGQKTLGKSCDIRLSSGKSDTKPTILEEKSGVVQYSDLFLYENSTYAEGLKVTGFRGDNNRMIIFQGSYANKPVVEIKASAFSETDVEEVIITDGIKRISERAFCGCTRLNQVIFAHTIKELADYAFAECSNLVTAALPPFLEQIGAYAMTGTKIKTVVFPGTLYWIAEGAFSYCHNIKEFNVPALLTEIAPKLLQGCENLKKVKIHDRVSSIGDLAFEGCSSLEELIIPDSVQSIGENAFDNVNDRFILICSMGSYAEEYARKNKLRYQLV